MAETAIRIWFSSSFVFNHNPSFLKSLFAIPSWGSLRDVFANRIVVLWPDLNLHIFYSLSSAYELEPRVNLFPIKNTLVPSYVRSVHYWLHRGTSCKVLWGPLSQHGLVVQASCSVLKFLSLMFLSLIFWKEKSLFLCSLQRLILTKRSCMLHGLIWGNSSSTAMGFHCFARVGQILSCPLFDYKSCNCNNTEKVVVLELCVLLWLCWVFLWTLKKQLAHISVIPSFLCEPMSLCRACCYRAGDSKPQMRVGNECINQSIITAPTSSAIPDRGRCLSLSHP